MITYKELHEMNLPELSRKSLPKSSSEAIFKALRKGLEETQFLTEHVLDVVTGKRGMEDGSVKHISSGFKNPGIDAASMFWFTLFMFVTVRVLQATVFPLISYIVGVRNTPGVKSQKVAKFAESCRELSFYCVTLFFSYKALFDRSWMYNLDEMWKFDRQFLVDPAFKGLYFFEASWYFSGMISLFVDAKKKDFFQMLAHHVFTVLLLMISFHESHMRVGAVVFVLHNISDPFLQMAKLFKYLFDASSKKKTLFDVISTIAFVCFMIAFFATRLVFYPQVIYSCHFRGPSYFFDRSHNLMEKSLIGLLTALLPIHLFWFYLIVKVAIKAVKGSSVEDTRSDSDEEDEAPPTKTKKTQ